MTTCLAIGPMTETKLRVLMCFHSKENRTTARVRGLLILPKPLKAPLYLNIWQNQAALPIPFLFVAVAPVMLNSGRPCYIPGCPLGRPFCKYFVLNPTSPVRSSPAQHSPHTAFARFILYPRPPSLGMVYVLISNERSVCMTIPRSPRQGLIQFVPVSHLGVVSLFLR